MDFYIAKQNQIAPVILQRFGYAPYINRQGEHSYVRRVQGAEFPRFHLYISEEDKSRLRCSLHLDQKRPSYMGTHAHGGDYDSEIVRTEVARFGGLIVD